MVGPLFIVRAPATVVHVRPSPSAPPNMTFRKIPRDVHEQARDATRSLMATPEFAKSRNERKKVEMRFAHLKTHHGFERMRLRGLSGARGEFHLAAIVQNLKTLANYIWRPLLTIPVACVAWASVASKPLDAPFKSLVSPEKSRRPKQKHAKSSIGRAW